MSSHLIVKQKHSQNELLTSQHGHPQSDLPPNFHKFLDIDMDIDGKSLTASKMYKETIAQISHLLSQFDSFTNNLEQKVDGLLQSQQQQFVTSYKKHMKKVENEVVQIHHKLQQQQQLISYYQNEGKMSHLIKRVAGLEEEAKKLYALLEGKDKVVRGLELELKVQREENRRLMGQVKDMVKNKNQIEMSKSDEKSPNHTKVSSNNWDKKDRSFGSINSPNQSALGSSHKKQNKKQQKSLTKNELKNEIHNQFKAKKLEGNQEFDSDRQKFFTTEVRSLNRNFSSTTQNQNLAVAQPQSPQIAPLSSLQQKNYREKISILAAKCRKLQKMNTKILSERSQLEEIFVNAVGEIKRQISMKKKMRECSFEDFRNQDKINILLLIVSNEQILRMVYEKIFHKNRFENVDKTVERNTMKSIQNRTVKSYSMQKYGSFKMESLPVNTSNGYLTTTNCKLKRKKQLGVLPYL